MPLMEGSGGTLFSERAFPQHMLKAVRRLFLGVLGISGISGVASLKAFRGLYVVPGGGGGGNLGQWDFQHLRGLERLRTTILTNLLTSGEPNHAPAGNR